MMDAEMFEELARVIYKVWIDDIAIKEYTGTPQELQYNFVSMG